MRHAKAETGFGLADIDRPLAERGRGDATRAGAWLRDAGLNPELVRCSPAVRTRQTLERLGAGAPEVSTDPAIEIDFDEVIYDNDPDALLDLIRQTPEDVRILLLIGHNPSLHHLVHDLAGESPDTFPTCAIAVIELASLWQDARPGAGGLTAYWTPRSS